MKSLFEHAKAFAPFYDDIVAVEGPRGGRTLRTGALPACVFDQGIDDMASDGATAATRRSFTVVVRVSDWPDTSPPGVGDTVTLADGTRLSVVSVGKSHGKFDMEARSC